jgi:hypothetical protein
MRQRSTISRAFSTSQRAADARQHDAHDRIGRLKDGRVGPFADLDIARSLEDCGCHGWFSFGWLSGR